MRRRTLAEIIETEPSWTKQARTEARKIQNGFRNRFKTKGNHYPNLENRLSKKDFFAWACCVERMASKDSTYARWFYKSSLGVLKKPAPDENFIEFWLEKCEDTLRWKGNFYKYFYESFPDVARAFHSVYGSEAYTFIETWLDTFHALDTQCQKKPASQAYQWNNAPPAQIFIDQTPRTVLSIGKDPEAINEWQAALNGTTRLKTKGYFADIIRYFPELLMKSRAKDAERKSPVGNGYKFWNKWVSLKAATRESHIATEVISKYIEEERLDDVDLICEDIQELINTNFNPAGFIYRGNERFNHHFRDDRSIFNRLIPDATYLPDPRILGELARNIKTLYKTLTHEIRFKHIAAHLGNALKKKKLSGLDDVEICMIPFYRKYGLSEEGIKDRFSEAMEQNFLLAADQLNFEMMQGSFDAALHEKKGRVSELVRKSLDRYTWIWGIDKTEEQDGTEGPLHSQDTRYRNLEQICLAIPRQALDFISALDADGHLSGKDACSEIHFAEQLVRLSGNSSVSNLESYFKIMADLHGSRDGMEPEQVRSSVIEYLELSRQAGIKNLSVPIYSKFVKADPSERTGFIRKIISAKNRLIVDNRSTPSILEPTAEGMSNNFYKRLTTYANHYGISAEELMLLLQDISNIDKFTFKKPDLDRIVFTHVAAAPEGLPSGWKQKSYRIPKIVDTDKNNNLPALRTLFNRALSCFDGGELLDRDTILRQEIGSLANTLYSVKSRCKGSVRGYHIEDAIQIIDKHFKKDKSSSSQSLIEDLALLTFYIQDNIPGKKVVQTARRARERLLIYRSCENFPVSGQMLSRINVDQKFYPKTDIARLVTFYAHLTETLNMFDIRSKNQLIDSIMTRGGKHPRPKSQKREHAERLQEYLIRHISVKDENPEVNRYPLNILQQELTYMRNNEKMTDDDVELTFIPGRSLLDEFAGAMGCACYFSRELNPIMKMDDLINIRILTGNTSDDSADTRISGNALLIPSIVLEKGSHVPNMIIRADNPGISGLSMERYMCAIEDYCRRSFSAQLREEGYTGPFYISRPDDPKSNQAMTNNAELFLTVKQNAKGKTLLQPERFIKFNNIKMMRLIPVVKGYVR